MTPNVTLLAMTFGVMTFGALKIGIRSALPSEHSATPPTRAFAKSHFTYRLRWDMWDKRDRWDS